MVAFLCFFSKDLVIRPFHRIFAVMKSKNVRIGCPLAVLLVVAMLVLAGCVNRNSAEDHYNEGCQLEQQGRKGDALKAYRLAQEEGGTSEWAVEATLAMGNLQLLAGNRDDALTAFRYAFDLSQISRDTLRMVYALRDMSRCLRSSEWIASAANCFIKADGLAQAAHLDEARADLWPEWVDVALQQGDKEQVNQLLEEIDSLERSAELGASSASAKSEEDGLGAMWLARGRALLWLGREAEAEEALLHASESANVKTHAAATMLLSQMESGNGRYESAWLSAMECVAMMDSVNRQTVRENGDLVSSLEDQIGVERENGRLRLRLWGVALLALLSIVGVVAFFRWRIRHLQAQVVTQSRRQEEQRLAAQEQNRSQQDRLLAAFRQSVFYADCERIGQGGSGEIDDDTWVQVQTLLNEHADGFVNRLVVFYPKIKPAELRMCCLIRLGLGNLQISNIFHRTQQATTNARKRLFTRMFEREGTADELNQFVMSF